MLTLSHEPDSPMRVMVFVAVFGLLSVVGPDVSAQDITAEPNFGSLSLTEGFVPDPQVVNVTSGGSMSVKVSGCNFGYVSSAPDVDLYYTSSRGSDLFFYVEGQGDTTLLINTPTGDWVCDDDGFTGTNPLVTMRSAPDGLYNVWVGSYSNDFHDATLLISEVDPSAPPSSGPIPDYSLEPTYGNVSLDEGFLPDPYDVDVVAGGPLELNMGQCAYGNVAEAPDFDLYYSTSGGSDLYIYSISGEDTTLLINTPSGNWLCNDDAYFGNNPLIVVPNAPDGLYDIWVGTYGSDTVGASLYVSEIDPR